jgi:hypothetical protein
MNIVALLALVAGIVAVSFIAWIFIVELANGYGERRAERDREEPDAQSGARADR